LPHAHDLRGEVHTLLPSALLVLHVRALPLGVLEATDLRVVVEVAPLIRRGWHLVTFSIFEG